MEKYSVEDKTIILKCSNAGETNIDLPNLFCFKLCLSPSNDSINNLKDYGDYV